MKYMMLIYGAENGWTPDERTACMVQSLAICEDLIAQGRFIDASPLQPVSTAVTVRVRNGRPLVTDGPFAETTEQLGGYYVLDLDDLDEAIAVAERLPPAAKGTVEIRPMFPLDGLPPSKPLSEKPDGTPYLFMCYHNEAALESGGPDTRRHAMAEAVERCHELADAGRYLSASPLHPAATATCVRVRDGKRVVTDGPFAETHEVLGGYYLIVAGSRDEAAAAAARQPGARLGAVEVRPLHDLSDLRQPKSS
ncbi:MAG TPA: YciI family protein [Gemmataceae bacterium]|jgi:hypothetical protein|nr:YciI family protein [Gemmataceae bacterium]